MRARCLLGHRGPGERSYANQGRLVSERLPLSHANRTMIQRTFEKAPLARPDVGASGRIRTCRVRWLVEQGVTLAMCQSGCGRTSREARSRRCQARNPFGFRTARSRLDQVFAVHMYRARNGQAVFVWRAPRKVSVEVRCGHEVQETSRIFRCLAMWDRPSLSPRIGDVEMQVRRTRAAVTLLVAMLSLVAGCTAVAPERQPEATHSATPSPIELERAIGDYIANGSVALGTINSVVVEVDGIRQLELYRNGGGPNHYSHVWSVTKSVVSTLVGIAIAEGKIGSLDAAGSLHIVPWPGVRCCHGCCQSGHSRSREAGDTTASV